MQTTQLWWVDSSKALRRYELGSVYPDDIQTDGRLYLYKSNPNEFGSYLLYNLSAIPSVDLSKIDDSAKLGQPISFRLSETSYAKAYDALRRSGWSVKHTNKSDRVKDDRRRAAIDQDLVVSTNELSDVTNLICFVNGQYHRHGVDPNTNEIYITDGAQTLRAERTRNDVTVIDYTPVGGNKLFPITKDLLVHEEILPKSLLIDLSSLKVSLKDYTPYLLIDGYMHSPGVTHRSVSDSVIEVTVSTLNLVKNYLTSSYLRNKPFQIPVTDGVNPLSDMHDSLLDVFVNSTTIPTESIDTNEWILSRITSTHSAILLVPKTAVALYQTVQHETDSSWTAVMPTKDTVWNGLLDVDGKKFSPLYLHTGGYRDRTLIASPYRNDNTLNSFLVPENPIVASPFRDVRNETATFNSSHISKWWNIPALGEFR